MKSFSLCEDFIIHCLIIIFSGIIDHAHLRQSADKELTRTVMQESHYYSDHSSINVIFKNVLWIGEPLFASFPSFHILTRCWTFSSTTHWSSDAVPRAHDPVHHLQNISPTPILPTCSAMSTEPSQSKITLTGTFGCDYSNILGLQLHNLFSPWMMISLYTD